MSLIVLSSLPRELGSCKITELHDVLGGPTLIHLQHGKGRPLFVSTLLHGNEHSGFLVLQKWFRRVINESFTFKRPIIFFIGNTLAARTSKRKCDNESDFNRVWKGTDCELGNIAGEVLSYVQKERPLAAIDIHNNSGKNPFYTCVNKVDKQSLWLARFFSEKIIFFTDPCEILANNFLKFCPAITIEAGKSRDPEGMKCLEDRLGPFFDLIKIGEDRDLSRYDVLKAHGRIRLTKCATVDFLFDESSTKEFSFPQDVENFNFELLKMGEVLCYCKSPAKLSVITESGEDVSNEFFEFLDRKVVVKKPFIPTMITTDITILKDDCFAYIMAEVKL